MYLGLYYTAAIYEYFYFIDMYATNIKNQLKNSQ